MPPSLGYFAAACRLVYSEQHGTTPGVVSFPNELVPAMASGAVRMDENFFAEYLTNSCSAVQHDEDDEAHSGMTKTARNFLKKKFGTISRFYFNITTADTADVNGFSRINTLQKALGALDRGGWERSYHQSIFHVSPCTSTTLTYYIMLYSHTRSLGSRFFAIHTTRTRVFMGLKLVRLIWPFCVYIDTHRNRS